jgi:predicted aspartyl protease
MRIPLDRSYRSALVVPLLVYHRELGFAYQLDAAVDTGASAVMIPAQVARFLDYAPGAAGSERIVTGNDAFEVPRLLLSRAVIGSASATDVQAVCHDLPEECPVDALVGLSFLTRFRVTLDFDAWEMELVPRA